MLREVAVKPAQVTGSSKIEMHFLPDVYCGFVRSATEPATTSETLEVHYKEKNISTGLGHDGQRCGGILPTYSENST